MRVAPLTLVACALAATVAGAQPTVVLREPASGAAAEIVRAALAGPRAVIVVRDSIVHLRRDTTYAATLVIIGGSATVASTVRGDVIVTGGDLWIRPGADIAGRAIAIGGGAYPSSLGRVAGGLLAFRDETFDADVSAQRIELRYRRLPSYSEVTRPGLLRRVVGAVAVFQLPTYDRVDGLSLPWGPSFGGDSARLRVRPRVTYRSHLGALDPSVTAIVAPRPDVEVRLFAGRTTATNDAWIRADLMNSLTTLWNGRDSRNYFRADRGELVAARTWEGKTQTITAGVGARTERAWSVGTPPPDEARSVPWSLFGRDSAGTRRPNPSVDRGRTSSLLATGEAEIEATDLTSRLRADLEVPWQSPGDERYLQTTLDARVAFPGFRDHRFVVNLHGVATVGDTPPPQRFAYVGGSGTISTMELLEMGGDRLVYVKARYEIPLQRPRLPVVGTPTAAVVYGVGGAGVGEIPRLVQNVGARLTLGPLRVEWLIDPESRDTKLSLSLTTGR